MWLATGHGILIISLLIFIGKKQVDPFEKRLFWVTSGYKILMGLLLGYFYYRAENQGDTFYFFHQASALVKIAQTSIFTYIEALTSNQYPTYLSEYRNEAFIKVISVIMLFTGTQYWVVAAWLSFGSFFIYWNAYKMVQTDHEHLKFPLLIGLLLIPSGVLWSSGLFKDTLANAAVVFLLTVSYKYFYAQRFRYWEWIGTFGALWFLLNIRYYLAALMLIILGVLLLDHLLLKQLKKPYRIGVTIFITLLAGATVTTLLHWNLHVHHLPQVIVENHLAILEASSANTLKFQLQPTWGSILIHLPQALFAGLFRPLPGEGSSYLIPFTIENFFLLVLFFINIYQLIKTPSKILKSAPLLIYLIAGYLVVLAVFIPLSVPNFGSMLRYKAAYTPFLYFLLLIIPFRSNWIKKWRIN